MIRATGHQLVSLCRSVVEEEKNQLLGPLMTSEYSGNVPYDSVMLWFHHLLFCLQSLMRCWINSTRGLPYRGNSNVWLTQQTPVGKTLILNSLGDGCALDAPSKRRRGTLLASWLSSASPGPLMLQTSWASFTAEYVGRMCRSSLTEDLRSSGTFKDTAILLATNGFASRHLAGGCWISIATHSLRTNLRDSGRRLCLRPL